MIETIKNNCDLISVILLSIIALAIVIKTIIEIINTLEQTRGSRFDENVPDENKQIETNLEDYCEEQKTDNPKDNFIQEANPFENNIKEIKGIIKQNATEIIKKLDERENNSYYNQLKSHMLRIVNNLIDDDNICECYRICVDEMSACSLVGNDKDSYSFYAFLNEMESYILSLCDDFEPMHHDNFNYIEHNPNSVSAKRTGKIRYTIKKGKKYKGEVVVKAIVCLDE